ncbi:RNA polymerase sigma factor [Streptomyces griseoviridis]|uniref:RNA polymerase subunit sigma-70 n=2 Tax=Streptomyces TaxID=1883 RepID=A0A3Q9KZ89_STRGD|nr:MULTISPECIES: sigma-70 family RNA polymerase sigma factor [Streptomyces]AZS89300.1 sigma-70 family RNA polymerase sigma factor [Streptomyces griseoviridis]MDH6699447.1 RNA polymerase sigma-70 factor (ECF subfamily) [Streptomyces sp. MAA16]MDT0477667.1 sigma-70 family RNA polymerase sigma factor [Streptomyces sp. DSM 41014]QCN83858.1 RNA polymerase subunit sigma-70 [Streptomyces griseoviridis]
MAGARRETAPPDTSGEVGETDDALLAVRAAEGDEDAFAVLVQRHAPALIRLATRLLDTRTEAEDAVQDAFISAWRRLPEFHGRSAFGTWMYRIVTNRCLNILRARRPVSPLEAARDVAAPDHSASPSRITEARGAVRELRAALDDLSPEQRACWVLREWDGQSYEFIADAVGISQEAVRARVFRARRSLTQALGAWR